MKTYLLYHNDCPDGFGSAWAFWKKYGQDITYLPVVHGRPLPELKPNSTVYIVDFSYDRETLLNLQSKSKKIVLLDHHKSAQSELEGLDFATFDLNKSGAILAWEYLFPDDSIPLLLQYIQDRDLWTWKLENSKEVNAFIDTIPYDFFEWEILFNKLSTNLSEVIKTGTYVLKNIEKKVGDICSQARVINFEGYDVPCANSVILQSEIGHELLNRYPNHPFSVIWYVDDHNDVGVSFRSRGDFDVSELARNLGGGGHPAAAGCKRTEIPL